jgi:hypothetical protein
LVVFRADTGEALAVRDFLAGKSLTAADFSIDGQIDAFGFGDGSVRLGRLTFTTDFVTPDELPEALRKLKIGGGDCSLSPKATPPRQPSTS